MNEPSSSRKTGASNTIQLLYALDHALDNVDLSEDTTTGASPPPRTPARKRKPDENDHGGTRAKRADRGGGPETTDRDVLSPRRAAANAEYNMQKLFPTAFLESPKGKSDNITQIRRENEKIGPPLPDALETLGLVSPNDYFPGLEIKLMKHQIIGSSWMLLQELDITNQGGILADEMGLGKTIQMIALMVAHQRDSDLSRLGHGVKKMRQLEEEEEEEEEESVDRNRKGKGKAKKVIYGKTTLIVAPASLLRQWREEIETKCQEGLLRVHIHHGKDKLKNVKEARRYDVILTSYQTLTAEFPTKLNAYDLGGWEPDMGGVLAKMKWYRVVLDEAQVVRNRMTQSAQCIFRLQTKYKWCLSGTPIFNSVSDIFSYLRFCRPGYYSWDNFNQHIYRLEKTDPAAATKRANEWLETLMLRRTKQSKLDGKFILEELPPKTLEIVELEFSEGERKIYDDLQARVEKTVKNIMQRGEEDKYHLYILVLILRLRQVCGHPALMLGLKDPLEDPTKMPQREKEKEVQKARRVLGSQFVTEMKKKFQERAMNRDPGLNDEDERCCRGCQEVFSDNAMVIACGHEACIDCLEDLAKSELQHEKDLDNLDKDETTLRPCPTCKKLIDPTKAFKSAAFEVSEEELVFGGEGFRKLIARQKNKKNDFIIDSDDEDMPDASSLMKGLTGRDVEDDEGTEEPIPVLSQTNVHSQMSTPAVSSSSNLVRWKNKRTPSTKLVALVNMIKEWQYDTLSAGDKIIVYSQWTSMLDLVEELFEQYSLPSLRYDGKMGREERDETIARFKKAGGPKIILISIKSGSVGLNLTCANRIINLDLSWNMAAENQAYDRAHRIGQSKPVSVKRFVIKDTIEGRILELQRDKQQMADATLGEGDAPVQRVSASLTTRELTSLIVPVEEKKKTKGDK